MEKTYRFFLLKVTFVLVALTVSTGAWSDSADGEGVDAQILWPTPGPSNFATVASSDIVPHSHVAFSTIVGYARQLVGAEIPGVSGTKWLVRDQFGADFLWAFGVFDILQLGLVLPVVFHQDGKGTELFASEGALESDVALASSALRDMRVHVKGRFLGGNAEQTDRRGIGLAADVGMALPTGDERSFAGDAGMVVIPQLIVDYHKCKFSTAINLGARLRLEENENVWPASANLGPGHQGTVGLGATGHLFDRRFLVGAEATGIVAIDGFDRFSVEYRGSVGYVADRSRSVTLWLSGGTSAGTGDLLGTPLFRVLFGLVYAPKGEDEVPEGVDEETSQLFGG